MRYFSFFLAFLFLLYPFSISLASNPYEFTLKNDEFAYDDSQDKPWQEDTLSQLSLPNNEKLLELKLDNPPIGFQVFIDEDSLQVSESDYVIRYWLVLKAGKSRNAQFEGIKCTSREYKVFAFENKWDKSNVKFNPIAKWEDIPLSGHNQFREEMRKYFMCNTVQPRKKEEILRRIKGYVNFETVPDYKK